MRQRIIGSALGLAAMVAAVTPAIAKISTDIGDLSMTAAVVSDYRYRGVSRSDEHPAAQGSIDWAYSGVYAGIGGSNVDFDEAANGYLELVLYGGYRFRVGGLNLNVGITQFLYPGESPGEHYQYAEGKLIASHDFGLAEMNVGVRVAPRYYDNSGVAVYPSAGFTAPIARTGVSATGSIGHLWVEKEVAGDLRDYTDWSLGLSYPWQGMELAARYVDTSLRRSECGNACSATVVLSVARTF